MSLPLSVLVACATLVYLWHRGGLALLRDWLAPGVTPLTQEPIILPADLEANAKQFNDGWAYKSTVAAMLEDYAELGDWNRVRVKHGHATIPEGPT